MKQTAALTPGDAYTLLYSSVGLRGWWPVSRCYPSDYTIPADLSERAAFEKCAGATLTQNTAWSHVEKAMALPPAGAVRSLLGQPRAQGCSRRGV